MQHAAGDLKNKAMIRGSAPVEINQLGITKTADTKPFKL
jgi:hypothetical protein